MILKLKVHGGHGYFRTLRRPLWELYRAIIVKLFLFNNSFPAPFFKIVTILKEMFFEAPFLSLLIFGFPFSVISIVFYFLCCADTSDQSDEEEFNSDTEDDINDEQYYIEAENCDDQENKNKTVEDSEETKKDQ